MKPIPGSCTVPRLSISLSSWRIWSPTRSGRCPCAMAPPPTIQLGQELDLRARHQPWLHAVDLVGRCRKLPFDLLGRRRHGHDAQPRTLPEILMVHFGNRHVELLQPVLHAPEHHPLFFQGMRVRNVELDVQDGYSHAEIQIPTPTSQTPNPKAALVWIGIWQLGVGSSVRL